MENKKSIRNPINLPKSEIISHRLKTVSNIFKKIGDRVRTIRRVSEFEADLQKTEPYKDLAVHNDALTRRSRLDIVLGKKDYSLNVLVRVSPYSPFEYDNYMPIGSIRDEVVAGKPTPLYLGEKTYIKIQTRLGEDAPRVKKFYKQQERQAQKDKKLIYSRRSS